MVLIIIGLVLLIVIITIATSVKVVNQSTVYVIEKLGKYSRTLDSGLHITIPFIERVSRKVDIREQVVNFPPQPVITKDNVTMQIDTVIYVAVTDPVRYCYAVGSPITALENLSATTLRNIIGELELDETLTSRDFINTKIRAILDEATDAWGMKVTRVEVKNIIPPTDIQEAMEKQMPADRQKREKILTAQANNTAAITEAQGIKEAKILRAEAERQEKILIAEGEADAIIKVQEAYAESIERLNIASPTSEILQLKGYEAFEKMADGKATKMIIPSNMQDIASLAAIWETGKDLANDADKK